MAHYGLTYKSVSQAPPHHEAIKPHEIITPPQANTAKIILYLLCPKWAVHKIPSIEINKTPYLYWNVSYGHPTVSPIY